MKVRALLLPIFALAAGSAIAQTAAPAAAPVVTLHVGDTAPALTIVKWLKGTPQTNLKDGKVHVVEFWATWCGPCKVGMPHLSELAHEFRDKVAFIGVDGSESKDDVDFSQAFVNRAGKMMDYNVAYATPRGAMSTDWMKAAGQNGIPCCFVVDKEGKIGWIGHPLMGLEEALKLAVDGKLTPDAAKTISSDWEAKLAKGEELMKSTTQAIQDGKTDEALALNDQTFASWPFIAPQYSSNRYELLTAKDPAAAKAYGDSLLKEKSNAPYVLRQVASSIINEKSNVKGERDYKLALQLLKQADASMEPTWSSNSQLAQAAFKTGDKTLAVDAQSKAVATLQQTLSTANFGTSEQGKRAKESYDKMLAEAQATLDTYKTAAQAKG